MPAVGKITQVIGSTFDAEFPEDQLPKIYNAIKIESNGDGQSMKLTGEVASHLGGGRIRAVALGSTDGLRRGMDVTDTGATLVWTTDEAATSGVSYNDGTRYGVAQGDAIRIGLALAQEDLAQLLGASRQRVNQELKGFEREGAVRVEPTRLVVLSREKLMAIAGR